MHLPVKTNDAAELVETLLGTVSERTVDAYRDDLARLADFCGGSLDGLLAGGSLAGNRTVAEFRKQMIADGRAAATINRRLSAIRSLVSMGRALGLLHWAIAIPGVKQVPYRDTRGPDAGELGSLFEIARARTDAKGIRDLAILRLLFDLGLRREEVVELDLEHVVDGAVLVRGKGHHDRDRMTTPAATVAAIAAWIQVRGTAAGPLFHPLDSNAKAGARLTASGLYKMVRRLGDRAGVRARPHGLRHAAITTALDLTGGDVRAVQKFSRHAKVDTVIRYDDNRRDLAGDVASQVAGSI